ncbi:DNA-binding transcriptional LysR family regulator [Lysinibacter cavernae]|uniref:DNA-binding transcriptional LysR family regulator n=2 Tax=Lysinibacter cavernae TaxID=1640652 RepID=A0A7X5TRP8_9MICO|nr:DNA-binding transcriptional LysR family regulator [Lysinibacter cavernae]
MIKRLEVRVGASLFRRTSRRVELSEIGMGLAADIGPSFEQLRSGFGAARAAALSPERPLRIGFQCAVYESVARAVTALPDGATQLIELPWSDPFGEVKRETVDIALVLAPNREPGLRQLLEFSSQPQLVGLSASHPLASESRMTLTQLGTLQLVGPDDAAPAYWRAVNAPLIGEDGHQLNYSLCARTLPEALSLVATQQAAVLLCMASAKYLPRPDVVYLPVVGLPDTSLIAVTQQTNRHPLVEEFALQLSLAV